MASPSGSEGEIIESDKANLIEHTLRNGSVDRKSRDPESAAHTPAAQVDGVNERLRSWSRSPRRNDRSRSRSPYRNRRSDSPRRRARSPRGAKRRRQSPDTRRTRERYDPRDQRDRPREAGLNKNSYRDIRSNRESNADYQRSHVSYADIDRGTDINTQNSERAATKRDPRAWRHSPEFRNGKSNSRNERRGPQTERRHDDRYTRDDDRGESTSLGRSSEHQSGPNKIGALNEPFPPKESGRKQEKQRGSVHFDESAKEGDNSLGNSQDQGLTTMVTAHLVVDEDALIEERRKKREAIKAKYKSQGPPLIIQAFQNQDTTDTSPNSPMEVSTERSERSVSPMFSTPTTPGADTAAQSPMQLDVENDMDLAHRPHNTDETLDQDASAADYDASMDMQEDRAKYKNIDFSSSEKLASGNEFPKDANTEVKGSKPPKKEIDMFAEDDDDDMFASVSPTRAKIAAEPQVQEAKALDRGLLDDWDDHQGYYKIILGELLDTRYHVKEHLGKGVFSGVVRAYDNLTGRAVAIKIIRNNETMRKAGQKEIAILEKLKENDVDDKKHVVRFERQFEHKDHLCMVFENLSINLREVLKKFGRDIGINIQAVRTYAHQMFLALGLLKKCNVLHADLKPDNMLVNDKRNVLKVADLGSAAESEENEITPYLVSRFYRAPEIILGMRYDFAIDMWSVGCTLFELYTGKILFTGRSNNQMLRSIQETRGKLTLKLLKKCEYAGLHFDDDGSFRSMEKDASGRDAVRILNFTKTAESRDLKSRLLAVANSQDNAELKEVNLFADLLDRCLALNPEKRLTPSQALQHPFIQRSQPRQLMAPSVRRPVKSRT